MNLNENFLLKGAREHKFEMKKMREQKEEERRKQVDIEEEKLAAERRREQIEKAKQLQYYETDRVRKFHVIEIVPGFRFAFSKNRNANCFFLHKECITNDRSSKRT